MDIKKGIQLLKESLMSGEGSDTFDRFDSNLISRCIDEKMWIRILANLSDNSLGEYKMYLSFEKIYKYMESRLLG